MSSDYVRREDGFSVPGALTVGQLLDRVITRAMQALVASMDERYVTGGGTPKVKTGKHLQMDRERYEAILLLLERDFRLATDSGNTSMALHWRLLQLAAERDQLIKRDDGGYLVKYPGAPHVLADFMAPGVKL